MDIEWQPWAHNSSALTETIGGLDLGADWH